MLFRSCDCIIFVEHPHKKDSIQVRGQMYNEPGEKIGGSSMGDLYHIILFRDDKEDPEKYSDFDNFDAILTSPVEYISNLIKSGWYGIVAKKTTTSHRFIDKTLDLFKQHML